ncbi:MAG: bifunctional folylpolyglutamate synthase/dihydrofolate synthase [Verrucomicrobiia bacterium]
MNYNEAIKFLYDLRIFGAKFGLENTFKLAGLCGNPQDELNFIHIAGTNGKGSTCAMLESIYRAAGYKTGLFTSPHLVSFSERIQINRQPIAEEEIVKLVQLMQSLLKHFPSDHLPTFFEVTTVMALCYFCFNECDVVIWETGMGGRLDATNIVTPLASVITSIGIDHRQWLGYTAAEIAKEKAGIIKPRIPVLTAVEDEQALDVIIQTAWEKGSAIHLVTKQDVALPPLDKIELPLKGEHQRLNAALAIACVNVLQNRLPVFESAIVEGLSTVQWAGRFQEVKRSGREFILDGAHNPDSARVLRETFNTYYDGKRTKTALIIGILADKDVAAVCRELAPITSSVYAVWVPSQRSADPEQIKNEWMKINPNAKVTVCKDLKEAIELSGDFPLTLITGSFYLVGEALECLGISGATLPMERKLNEYKVVSSRAI